MANAWARSLPIRNARLRWPRKTPSPTRARKKPAEQSAGFVISIVATGMRGNPGRRIAGGEAFVGGFVDCIVLLRLLFIFFCRRPGFLLVHIVVLSRRFITSEHQVPFRPRRRQAMSQAEVPEKGRSAPLSRHQAATHAHAQDAAQARSGQKDARPSRHFHPA